MAYNIEMSDRAERVLASLDRQVRNRLDRFITERLALLDDPRSIGDALKGARLGDLWEYRVGAYRVITKIEDARLVILVVAIGHRREVYR